MLVRPRVTDLRPVDTEQDPYFYSFRVQCTSCRETHSNWVSVSRFVSLCLYVMYRYPLPSFSIDSSAISSLEAALSQTMMSTSLTFLASWCCAHTCETPRAMLSCTGKRLVIFVQLIAVTRSQTKCQGVVEKPTLCSSARIAR
jgi:hypothetical protein